jgi:hypothetical protein
MVDANTIDYALTIEDPSVYSRPWTMNYPVRRAGTGGIDNSTGTYNWRDTPVVDKDPYAREAWENACNDGIAINVRNMHSLGFKWFKGVTPPVR